MRHPFLRFCVPPMLSRRGFHDCAVPNPHSLPADSADATTLRSHAGSILPRRVRLRWAAPCGATPSSPFRAWLLARSARPGFFRPLRASPPATCRACSIPAASLGFSPSESVRVLSRTPLGSPCPSFPWPATSCRSGSRRTVPAAPRRAGRGSACVIRIGAAALTFRSWHSRAGAADSFAGCRRVARGDPKVTRGFVGPHAGLAPLLAPRRGLPRSRLRLAQTIGSPRSELRPPALDVAPPGLCRQQGAVRRWSVHVRPRSWSHDQDVRAGMQGFEPRTRAWLRDGCSPFAEARTSLGVSSLQGLTARTLRWISPAAPLSLLAVPRGPLPEPQGLDRSSSRQSFSRSPVRLELPHPPGFPTLVQQPGPANLIPSGSWFRLGARSALPPHHPLV
jgi:hypothetical protein